jgi:hypothetical protein
MEMFGSGKLPKLFAANPLVCHKVWIESQGGALTGWLKTLCASVILVNPLAKFALTLEPVAHTVRIKAHSIGHMPLNYITR